MSDAPRIVVRPHPALSPEDARDARAHALRYIFDRYFEKQKAAKASGGEKGSGEQRTPREPDKNRRQ